MADLYISEYDAAGPFESGQETPAVIEPSITTQKVAIGAASVQSAVLNSRTALVRLHCDVACHIEFGTAPTATASNLRMAANQTEVFAVQRGKGLRLAVINST